MFWRKSNLAKFRIAPVLQSGDYYQLKRSTKTTVEKGLVVVLFFMILFFQLFKRLDIRPATHEIPETVIYLNVEDIPLTRQGVKKPVPPRPVVPIPVEEPSVPEDLTLEETDIDFTQTPLNLPEGDGFFSIIPPRPIADVFPEYPKPAKENGVTGEIELSLLVDENGKVKNVQVVSNSTNNELCKQSAIQAAYQTQFIPAKKNEEFVAVWIRKTYKFGLN